MRVARFDKNKLSVKKFVAALLLILVAFAVDTLQSYKIERAMQLHDKEVEAAKEEIISRLETLESSYQFPAQPTK